MPATAFPAPTASRIRSTLGAITAIRFAGVRTTSGFPPVGEATVTG